MSDKESLGHAFLEGLRRLVDPSDPGADVPMAADGANSYRVKKKYTRRNLRNEPTMVDPSDVQASEAVRHAADERIRLEAIRQLDSIDLDDENIDGQIEPLPEFDSGGFSDVGLENENVPSDDATWDEVSGRFVSEDDAYFNRG